MESVLNRQAYRRRQDPSRRRRVGRTVAAERPRAWILSDLGMPEATGLDFGRDPSRQPRHPRYPLHPRHRGEHRRQQLPPDRRFRRETVRNGSASGLRHTEPFDPGKGARGGPARGES
jgi:hypothetical protein